MVLVALVLSMHGYMVYHGGGGNIAATNFVATLCNHGNDVCKDGWRRCSL